MSTSSPPPAEAPSSGKALDAVKAKGLKYSAVSVFNVLFGQGLLFILVHRDIEPFKANMLGVCISAVPAYYLSRAWVWGKKGKSDLRTEVIPFWIFVAIGLAMSTGSVWLASTYFPAPADAGLLNIRKLLPNAANMFAFGILWVIRFFWMDKAFQPEHHPHVLSVDVDGGETPAVAD